jgi:hypothetical protein
MFPPFLISFGLTFLVGIAKISPFSGLSARSSSHSQFLLAHSAIDFYSGSAGRSKW